jgi:rhamnogalacturonyl hydrolase YesR
MVKTYAVLKNSKFSGLPGLQGVYDEFKRAIVIVSQWQDNDGLWNCFIDRPVTGKDTSASAGIALAMAWGCQLGLLDQEYHSRAGKAYHSLIRYITPDGFLAHASQLNRGGEQLQESGYRVISHYGMGLMAQLKLIIELPYR